MSLLEKVKLMLEKKKEKSDKFKQLEEDFILNKRLADKQKSANERELEKWHKEEREDRIKKELDKIHQKKMKELWKSPHSVLKSNFNILKNDRPILKEKNIFANNPNLFKIGRIKW